MRTLLTGLLIVSAGAASAQFASTGLASTDASITAWATGVSNLTRGPMDITNPSLGLASFGTAASATGAADNSVVSLGDGGSITLTFANAISNGTGDDFAVFENGFISGSGVFSELGFVEVSSDGVNFFRFASQSLTQTTTQVASFATTDPTKIHNLAGQFVALQGTPFDLSELTGVSPLLDVSHVTSVRVVDVVGSIDPQFGTRDSLGNLINDPFKTPFASGGFDMDAVGVIHAVPEPTPILALLGLGICLIRRHRR